MEPLPPPFKLPSPFGEGLEVRPEGANQQVTKQIVDGESIPSLQVVKQCFQTARTIISDS